MKITKFAEKYNHPLDPWYETEDGVRHNCTEMDIECLHFKWVTTAGSKRLDNDDYVIYAFATPTEMPTFNPYDIEE